MAYLDQCDQSEIEYKGNGSQVLYTFPFTYMKSTDVYVDLYNETTRRWETADYSSWNFANATTIEFVEAPPTPTGTDVFNIRIARCTDIDPMIAQFNPGSAIRAVDLNDNFEQLQLAVEEGRCQIPTWLYDYLTSEYWNKFEETVYETGDWFAEVSDETIATSGATNQELIQRWDKRTETTYTTNNWTTDSTDSNVPTTGAVAAQINDLRAYVDTQDDADREYADDTFIRLDNEVDYTAQTTGQAVINNDKVFTTAAAAARFDVYSQDTKPETVTYEQPAKGWFDTGTLENYTWDYDAGAWVSMQNAGPPGPPGPSSIGTFIAPLVENDDTVSIDLLSLSKIL